MSRRIRVVAGGLPLLAAAMLGSSAGPAAADVQSVTGSAYGYSLQVSLLGSPVNTRGFGQVACSGNNPPGCAPNPTLSASPAVSLPSNGGNLSSNDADGATASVGPAIFFSATQLTTSSTGSTGPAGTVQSSAGATGINASGEEAFTATSVGATCTATESGSSASATVAGGVVQTDNGFDANNDGDFDDPGLGDIAPTTANVPTNPAPNTTINGVVRVNGVVDNFQYIFNEQIVAGGTITVNAVHQRLLGPSAVGDLYIGHAVCGVTAAAVPTDMDLAISDSPETVAGGGTVTYTVTASNIGSNVASDVTVTGTVTGGRVVSASSTGGTCEVSKGKIKAITCSLGTIGNGSNKTITIVAKAAKNTDVMSLEATVTSAADNNPANDSETEDTTVVK